MKKRVLLSLLENDSALAERVGRELAKAGLEVLSHVWNADLVRPAWDSFAGECANASAWVIAGSIGPDPAVRKSLSLAALAVQYRFGNAFPVFLTSKPEGELPDPLKDAVVVEKGLGAKCAVRAQGTRLPAKPGNREYRLRPLSLPGGLGLWFEIGPAAGTWKGSFFACGPAAPARQEIAAPARQEAEAISSEQSRMKNEGTEAADPSAGEAEKACPAQKDSQERQAVASDPVPERDKGAVPTHQGLGEKEKLPSSCTLEYPLRGARLSLGGVECEGWGVMNELDAGHSHFLRVGSVPDILAFGPFPGEDDCELYTVRLA